jgi:hypothetical protein
MRAQIERNFKFYPIIVWILKEKKIMMLLKKMLVAMIDLVVVGECKGKCWVLRWGKGKAKIVTVREILSSVLSVRHQMTCPKVYNVPTQ